MRMSHWLVSAAGALALGVLAMPVQAAPVGALTGNAAAQQGTSAAEQVNYRCMAVATATATTTGLASPSTGVDAAITTIAATGKAID
jgi:hypothetical protein